MNKTLSIMGQHNISKLSVNSTMLIYLLEEYKKGYKHFLIGTISNFDLLLNDAIHILKKIYPDLQVTILENNYKEFLTKKRNPLFNFNYVYSPLPKECVDVYINENLIIQSKYMIDNSDKFYCFFDSNIIPFRKLLDNVKSKNKEAYNLYEILNPKK